MEKQFLKRTCDSPLCDTVMIVEMGKEDKIEIARWVAVVTGEIVPVPNPRDPRGLPTQELRQNIKQACRIQCAINILKTAVEPPKQEKRASMEELQALVRGKKTNEDARQPAPLSAGDEISKAINSDLSRPAGNPSPAA